MTELLLKPLIYWWKTGRVTTNLSLIRSEIISLHEPHPQPEVKTYVIKQVVEQLQMSNRI